MRGDIDHLLKYYPRPKEDEELPIQFIDLEDKIAGWSPQLKKTVYTNSTSETNELKRIREITLLKVYNWLSNGESVIELSSEERAQFEDTMDEFTRNGGEIRYTRKKIDGKMINYFRLERNRPVGVSVKESLLAEKL